jgi:hypothetical protein
VTKVSAGLAHAELSQREILRYVWKSGCALDDAIRMRSGFAQHHRTFGFVVPGAFLTVGMLRLRGEGRCALLAASLSMTRYA